MPKPRKPNSTRIAQAAEIYRRLKKLYPDAHCALEHKNAFQLLIATILSAQCTDVRVNIVTPGLFKKYPTPKAFVEAPIEAIEEVIRSTGFYRNKARSIKGASTLLVEKFGGKVPDTMEELLQLPGVARKTANVVLGNAFGKNIGVVVDTHVQRLSNRMGLTAKKEPVKIEPELMALFPREEWTMLSHLLIFHGRQVCAARKPACDRCTLLEVCPQKGVPAAKKAR
ncbi:MAG: endonuclease III [Phycisphaeraceae bacterium]